MDKEIVNRVMNRPHLYYDRKGNPITAMEFSDLFMDDNYKIVKRDTVNGLLVSTVWLGVNYAFIGQEILIFETMIFKYGTWEDFYMERYATEEQAREGHEKAVTMAKLGEFNEKPG